MCGIAGGMGQLTSSTLELMAKRMSHRGPDNLSVESFDNVHLAHARLSIIDLSQYSNQPLWDKNNKACIVFNGEIFNYRELKADLEKEGVGFRSDGDSEVLLNLYLKHGRNCLQYLSGMFAFAIWDIEKQELFIARDQFGVKPLYYSNVEEGFYFASEIKSLLEVPVISRELDYDAVFRSVVFLWSPGPSTVLKSVKKLEPGSYLIVKDGQIVHSEKYWDWPEFDEDKSWKTIGQAKDALKSALRDSVKEQLVSDVPVGSFLSGGLDSSLIVSMAKEFSSEELPSFTIKSIEDGGEGDGFADDLPYARRVAEYLNVPLHVIDANPEALKLLPQMIYHLDEPQADPAPINVSLICQYASSQGIKVLLSGAGGDDVFSGYRRHRAISMEKYWSSFPKPVRVAARYLTSKLPKRKHMFRRIAKVFAYADLPANERLLSYFYWINPNLVKNLFSDQVKNSLSINPMSQMIDEVSSLTVKSPLEKMLYLERKYFLVDHNLNYTDKMSMAHGLEVRVPFLNKSVAEAASKIPPKWKQKGAEGKWILKSAGEEFLPYDVVYRPKTGFGAPLRDWLNNDLKALVDELLSPHSLSSRGIFDPHSVRGLIENDRAGREDYSYPIFSLLCIEIWCRIFVDKKKVQVL